VDGDMFEGDESRMSKGGGRYSYLSYISYC
jgi:hypothetical protein